MKKIFYLLLISYTASYSQWLPNPYTTGNIYFNGGFVGIGTSSPQGYLHINPSRPVIIKNNGGNGVYGSEIGFNSVLLTSSLPNQFKKLGGTNQAGGANMAVDYNGNILFQMYGAGTESESIINYSPQIVFQNNGYMGIGTTTPEAPLDLKGRQVYIGTIPVTMGYSATEYPSIGYNTTYTTSGLTYKYKGSDNASLIYFGQGGFSFKTAPSGTAGTNIPFAEAMTIKQDGTVGIGIVSPATKLDVSGTLRAQTQFHLGDNYSSGYRGIVVDNGASTSWDFLSCRNINGTHFRVLGNGNVGIGTDSPGSFKLAVNGKVWAQEVQVALTNPGPDYVFEPNYKLLTLEEIKSYIEKNKHLPEVPSAKEMETNGMNVSEMNMLLLKKIEELTLYVIEQNKKVELLNEKIYKLEQK